MATMKIGKLKNIDPTSSTYGNIFIYDLTDLEPSTINDERYRLVSNIIEVEFEELPALISEEQENITKEIGRLAAKINRLEQKKGR